jgi:hypothetical protein
MYKVAHIHASSYLVKRATTDPRILAALLGGGVGAAGGGMVQLVRKLLQSRRDAEENGSPSILRGMLMGGLGGAALGAGAEHLAQGVSAPAELAKDITVKQLREAPPVIEPQAAPISLYGLGTRDERNAVTAPPTFTRSGQRRAVPSAPFQPMLGTLGDASDPLLTTIRGMNAGSLPSGITALPEPARSLPEYNPVKLEAELKAQRAQEAQMEALAKRMTQKSVLSP